MKKRLIDFLAYLGIGQLKFEENVGLSRGYVNKIGDNITVKSLNKISLVYPELNINWLKTGEGEMLKDSQPARPEEGVPSNNNILVQHLLSQLEKLEQENKKLTEENKKLIADNGYYKGLLDNNKIDYSSKVS